MVEHPEVFALRPWAENEDPVGIVAALVGARRRLAVSDRTWATFVLALQQRLPGLGLAPVLGGDRAAAGGQGRERDRGPGRRLGGGRPGRRAAARRATSR